LNPQAQKTKKIQGGNFMSSVGNHSPGESFLSKIDIFKPTARNNSGEKTSSEAITLWGG
jgi:hypothetical protein